MQLADRWINIINLVGIHRHYVHGRDEFLSNIEDTLHYVSICLFAFVVGFSFCDAHFR